MKIVEMNVDHKKYLIRLVLFFDKMQMLSCIVWYKLRNHIKKEESFELILLYIFTQSGRYIHETKEHI